jgi:hypothetical protein
MQATARFPREHSHTVTPHMVGKALAALDSRVGARQQQGSQRATALRDADMALDQLKQMSYLALQPRLLSKEQCEQFSRLKLDVGRLLGGRCHSLNSGA